MNHDYGRYGFILCKYFQESAYKVAVRTSCNFFDDISRYKKPLLALNVHFVRSTPNPPNTVQLKQANGDTKTIRLKYGFEILQEEDYDCIAPYPMHPYFYDNYPSPEALETYRLSSRSIRILFSGNTDPRLYQSKELEATFRVLSRNNVLQQIKNHFENTSNLKVITDPAVLQQCLEKQDTKSIIINETKTEASAWLYTLSKSEFFICPPGFWMPWCHNLIEAMAVGTIPILQYAHFMTPKMEHLKNCLVYRGPEELTEVLQFAMNMSGEEMARMRAEVIDYFETYLSLQSVTKRISHFSTSDKAITNVALPYIYVK